MPIGTDLAHAVALLRAGRLVALPTETVYGLAADGLNEAAVTGIFAAKGRPRTNPLILHVPDLAGVEALVTQVPPAAAALLAAYSPGPLTLLLPKRALVPDLITAGLPHVAVRIPRHPLALAVLRALGRPLAAPSANRFAGISPTTAAHVQASLGDKVDYILDGGPCQAGIESTVVGFDEEGTPLVFRPGALSLSDLQRMVPGARLRAAAGAVSVPAASPGLLALHYSPNTPLRLVAAGALPAAVAAAEAPDSLGVLAFRAPVAGVPAAHQVMLSPTGDLAEAARHLYAALHHLDGLGLRLLLAERLPDDDGQGLGWALNDRLSRAATA